MEHQAQGHVLVNGEWVLRTLDVHQIMARAQLDDTQMRDTPTEPQRLVPEYGLLSRTMLASPLSNLILPANIRHKDLADVVLVGEDSVQLGEIRDYGRLRHVATKADFRGARILAAKVFGNPRETPDTESVSSWYPKKQPFHRARRSMTGEHEQVLPPEVIVLTLTSRTLMFLWAQQAQTGAVTFGQKTIRLPAGATRFDRFGAFLAVDHKRRALAVAALEGRFILYKTKSMEKWRTEIQRGSETVPIEDERIILIDGHIMHMEFLSSGHALDEFHVVLLFVLVVDGKTKLTCFDWDCRQDLSEATARTERVSVDSEDRNPSLLIPLRRSPDFLLVFDKHVSVYRDLLSGIPVRTKVPIHVDILSPLRPGDSKRGPRWVGWDKAPRNSAFLKEVFYIAREDGRVIYAECGPAGSVNINEAGDWPCRTDTAFACLSVDNSEFSRSFPDILIAGGTGNDGLLCRVGAWPTEYPYTLQHPVANAFTHIDTIPNWTPVTDLSVTTLSNSRTSVEQRRSTIFVANGNTPHGEISELRHGLQAFVDNSFSDMNGCTSLWVIDYGSLLVETEAGWRRQHYVVFAITLLEETLVINNIRTQPESRSEFSGAWEQGIWDQTQFLTGDIRIEDNVLRDEETISACTWSKQFSIQITRTEARILRRPSLQQTDAIEFGHSILLATSQTSIPLIATTFRDTGYTYLQIFQISHEGLFGKPNTGRYQLPYDSTCLKILDINGAPHVFIGTDNSTIMLFKIDELGMPSLVLEESLQSILPDQSSMVCESAVVLGPGEPILVCATRDGFLLSSHLDMHDTSTHLVWHSLKMGDTSVQIERSNTDNSAAFISCGSDFCRIRCSTTQSCSLEIDSIWFDYGTNTRCSQSPVTAMYQLPFQNELDSVGRDLGGFLFAVAGDQLLFSQLDSDIRWTGSNTTFLAQPDARSVPRKYVTGARPTSVVYMKSLRKLLVSTIEAKEELAPPNGYRVLHSMIKLMNLHDNTPSNELDVEQERDNNVTDKLVVAQYHLNHAERVYSVVEWPFVDHRGKKYTLIIVGTGIQVSVGKETGRRLIFSPGKRMSKLELQKESSYDSPVYCIAMWNNESAISVSGTLMSMDRFDSQDGRWFKQGSKDLPSPAMHISIKPPFVYVSTMQHSLICYEVVNAAREGHFDFQQIFTDSRERSCTNHLVLDLPNTSKNETEDTIALFTDKKSGSITALYHPPQRAHKNASDTLFEACLSRTVIRLQRGDIRPPWRRPAHPTEPSGKPTGVIVDDIIGACSDGTIYTFSILSQPARHLLRFLQNLIEAKDARNPFYQYTLIRTRSGDIPSVLRNGAEGVQEGVINARDIDPRHRERGFAGPRHKHVNGDLIGKWAEEDGDLIKLLNEDTDERVRGVFVELTMVMLAGTGKGGAPGQRDAMGVEDLAKYVRDWLDEVMMPLF